jgi:hypothetical protein
MAASQSIAADPRGNPSITIIVPVGRAGRRAKVRLPAEAAAWLRDQLIDAVGAPRPRRRPRLRRGRWLKAPTRLRKDPR